MFLTRKTKIILLVIGILFIGGYGSYKLIYKPHKTVNELPVDFKGETTILLQNLKNAPEKWTGKIVELEGNVSHIDLKGFMLNKTIYCQKNTSYSESIQLKEGAFHSIKGRIIGYDDLLEELKLDQVILIK